MLADIRITEKDDGTYLVDVDEDSDKNPLSQISVETTTDGTIVTIELDGVGIQTMMLHMVYSISRIFQIPDKA